jgi:YkoY family integral membrane protein
MPLLGLLDIFGQKVDWPDLAVVVLLVFLEGLLSIDNALVLGLLAKRLPKHEQGKALWYGLAGAFVFRVMAVLLASLLLRWTFAKFLGGAYLVYIAIRHLFFESKETGDEKVALDERGHPILVEETTGGPLTEEQEEVEIKGRVPVYMSPERRRQLGLASFWPTVLVIELTDIAFAVDSILAAIAMVGAPPKGHPHGALHPKLWVVIFGGIIGLMLMRVAASFFIKLLERFPRFELSAYLLVIIIGLKLLADWAVNSDWSFDRPPIVAEKLAQIGWKQAFDDFELRRQGWAHSYEDWLRTKWPLGLEEHHPPAPQDPAPPPPQEVPAQPQEAEEDELEQLLHIPHVLNFHSWRRPEFILFWGLMIVCFCIGFLPAKKKH